tara:strand:+ start:52 stop:291 length:240 start_codon:yes stop_codon:yes gene_type:complete
MNELIETSGTIYIKIDVSTDSTKPTKVGINQGGVWETDTNQRECDVTVDVDQIANALRPWALKNELPKQLRIILGELAK